MKFLAENWMIICFILALVIFVAGQTVRFIGLNREEQYKKVKEWLLWCVIYVEKELGSGVGVAKLRMAYDLFVQRFPALVTIISFETFSKWVDEALEQMKHLLKTNTKLSAYINSQEDET